jgi:hypothetical protein
MKIILQVFAVNAQDGFLVDDSNHICAAYNHHNKILVWREGLHRNMCELPANYVEYEDVAVAGHFNVGFWDMLTGDNMELVDVLETKPALIKRAKALLNQNHSVAYVESTMWAERDQNTSMRHIKNSVRKAFGDLVVSD